MRAYWLEQGPDAAIDEAFLASQGVTYQKLPLDPAAYQGPLDALKAANGYIEQDIVELSPETPNLEALCAKFVDEHLHTDDEVRYVLEGEGIFDLRSKDDRWMRVTVEPGDLLFFRLSGKKTSHVGIYVGDRTFVHAPSSGKRVQRVAFVHVYWGPRIRKAGRLRL